VADVKLDLQSARRIAAVTKETEYAIDKSDTSRRHVATPAFTIKVAKSPEGGIPARDKLKPGKAECKIYEFEDLTAEEPKLKVSKDASGEDATLEVFNIARTEIEENTMMLIQFGTGVWWCIVEVCDGAEDEEGEDEGES